MVKPFRSHLQGPGKEEMSEGASQVLGSERLMPHLKGASPLTPAVGQHWGMQTQCECTCQEPKKAKKFSCETYSFLMVVTNLEKKKNWSVLTKQKSSVCRWAVVCKIWPEPFWSKWYPASLKQTVLCRTVYSWKEIGISLEIAIFVGHEMVEYLQLYVVPCNITHTLDWNVLVEASFGCENVTQAFRAKPDGVS